MNSKALEKFRQAVEANNLLVMLSLWGEVVTAPELRKKGKFLLTRMMDDRAEFSRLCSEVLYDGTF
ncbi:hypothetical protein R6G85_02535 [Actinotignum urinale]|uniref:hypothetical protein n=1 Tax=Actinotignum urinale TaxID=190146 RepID=UPI002A828F7E|nr:hypothetical protein [Actinotignum urinale]MDY5151365.1 hypothetical protein [Actinotignum urinale]